MSQGQPIKPQADQLSNQEGIKYGDVFDVTSGLASKTIAPRDVAIMLEAETEVLRKPLDTGANAVMYSAATANLRVGVVGPDESNEMVEREDVAVSKSTDAQGKLVVNEAIADHVISYYNPYDLRGITLSPSPSPSPTIINAAAPTTGDVVDQSGIAIREALEATILSVGDKPVEQGDAATIRVAKARAASSRNST
ncbi:hypothetical protein V6Z12_A08G077300 [Gossypium hirsutum]